MKITSTHIKIATLQHVINTLTHGEYDVESHPNLMFDKIMEPASKDPDEALDLHNKYQPKLDDEFEKIIERLQKKLDKLQAEI